MNKDVYIRKVDETKVHLESKDSGILMEISEHFTFLVPGYKFMPSYKAKIFDGKIRIFNLRNNCLPFGLIRNLCKFLLSRGYTFEIDPSIINDTELVTKDELISYAKSLPFSVNGKPAEFRDYQLESYAHGISQTRGIVLSPTGCLDGDTVIEAEISDY